jgi:hypothetical protein
MSLAERCKLRRGQATVRVPHVEKHSENLDNISIPVLSRLLLFIMAISI